MSPEKNIYMYYWTQRGCLLKKKIYVYIYYWTQLGCLTWKLCKSQIWNNAQWDLSTTNHIFCRIAWHAARHFRWLLPVEMNPFVIHHVNASSHFVIIRKGNEGTLHQDCLSLLHISVFRHPPPLLLLLMSWFVYLSPHSSPPLCCHLSIISLPIQKYVLCTV